MIDNSFTAALDQYKMFTRQEFENGMYPALERIKKLEIRLKKTISEDIYYVSHWLWTSRLDSSFRVILAYTDSQILV